VVRYTPGDSLSGPAQRVFLGGRVPGEPPAGTFTRLLHVTIPHVSGRAVGHLGSPTLVWCGVGLTLMIFGVVVAPGVWSRRAARRKAAAEILDRILRFLRPRS